MWILQISELTKKTIKNHVLGIFQSEESSIESAKNVLYRRNIVDYIESDSCFNFKINSKEYSISWFQLDSIDKELKKVENL